MIYSSSKIGKFLRTYFMDGPQSFQNHVGSTAKVWFHNSKNIFDNFIEIFEIMACYIT